MSALQRRSEKGQAVQDDKHPVQTAYQTQCDETRPTCLRCVRTKKACHGYSTQTFSILHNENIYASRQRKRPQGPRARAVAPFVAPPVHTFITRDIHSEAVSFFFNRHLGPGTNGLLKRGFPNSTLSLRRGSSPILDDAVSSIALALFSRSKLYPHATTLAFDSYQKSLRTLQTALSAPESIDIDACLLAVCLLARYENVVYTFGQDNTTPLTRTVKNRAHLLGAMALLKFWVYRPQSTAIPTETIRHTRYILRKAAIFGVIEFPEWLSDGAVFGEHGSMLKLDRILVRVIHVRNLLRHYETDLSRPRISCAKSILALNEIEKELKSLDIALADFESVYSVSNLVGQTLADRRFQVGAKEHFFSHKIYSHQSHEIVAHCALFTGYRMLVIHLLIYTLKLIEKLSPWQLPTALNEYQQMLEDLTEDLRSIVPFGLDKLTIMKDPGQFGDHISIKPDEERRHYIVDLMSLPLLIASTSESIQKDSTDWFRSQLAETGRFLGYSAMELAKTTSWPTEVI